MKPSGNAAPNRPNAPKEEKKTVINTSVGGEKNSICSPNRIKITEQSMQY